MHKLFREEWGSGRLLFLFFSGFPESSLGGGFKKRFLFSAKGGETAKPLPGSKAKSFFGEPLREMIPVHFPYPYRRGSVYRIRLMWSTLLNLIFYFFS